MHVPETEDWGPLDDFFARVLVVFFFSPFLDAKRWDECDLAGVFYRYNFVQTSLSIHHSLLQEAAVG